MFTAYRDNIYIYIQKRVARVNSFRLLKVSFFHVAGKMGFAHRLFGRIFHDNSKPPGLDRSSREIVAIDHDLKESGMYGPFLCIKTYVVARAWAFSRGRYGR